LADDVCEDADDDCVDDVDAVVLLFELLEHPARSNAITPNKAMTLLRLELT
jgi:hypothetical protein